MNPTREGRELLTVEEVAVYLSLKPITIYAWCRDGRLPAIKLGKEWRIRRPSLEVFLEQSESRPTLVTQFQRFIMVPDTLLGIAESEEYLFQLDAAFFQVGQMRDALLVKIISGPSEPDDQWRAALEHYGLPVRQLEAEGQMHVIHLRDHQQDRAETLREIIETEGQQGRVVFANFNRVAPVSLDTMLQQQETITAVTKTHPLVVKTSLLQAITDEWASSEQREAQDRYAGMIWLSERGVGLRRTSPVTLG